MKERADFIFKTFHQLGVALNPASRLGRQVDVYLDPKEKLPQIIEPGHPSFETAVEAFRDLNQVAYSLKHLLPIISKEELVMRLRRLNLDNLLPQHDSERSPGRDVQCELFVAALCARAGLSPVFSEPDLRCKMSEWDCGVAIKRIKTPGEGFGHRFTKRMFEAAGQIEESGIAGMIVVDISHSLNPTNWWVPIEVSDSKINAALQVEMNRIKTQHKELLLKRTRGKGVRGVILIITILRCSPDKIWRMQLFDDAMNLSENNQRRSREFEQFYSCFQKAVYDPGPC